MTVLITQQQLFLHTVTLNHRRNSMEIHGVLFTTQIAENVECLQHQALWKIIVVVAAIKSGSRSTFVEKKNHLCLYFNNISMMQNFSQCCLLNRWNKTTNKNSMRQILVNFLWRERVYAFVGLCIFCVIKDKSSTNRSAISPASDLGAITNSPGGSV